MRAILMAVHGPAEPELVAALAGERDLRVERRCADIPELLAAAGARLGQVAVLSASFIGVDRSVVERLQLAGLQVVGLAHAEDAQRVRALGMDAVVETESGPSAVVAAIRALDATAPAPPPAPTAPDHAAAGRVVVVWGTHGAPGRTTLAIELAEQLTQRGAALLVDADTVAPALAQHLGIVDEASGLALACRMAAQGRLDTVRRHALSVGDLDVLTGLTRPDRWREVPGGDVSAVLEAARSEYDWIVVDVTGGLSSDEADPATAFAPTRNGAQLAALAAADHTLVVGRADAVGMYRLLTLLVDAPQEEALTVVNQVRRSAAPAQQLEEVLERLAGETDPLLVPEDRPGVDRAVRDGVFLSAAAPKSATVAAVAKIADRIAPSRVVRRGRRRRGRD